MTKKPILLTEASAGSDLELDAHAEPHIAPFLTSSVVQTKVSALSSTAKNSKAENSSASILVPPGLDLRLTDADLDDSHATVHSSSNSPVGALAATTRSFRPRGNSAPLLRRCAECTMPIPDERLSPYCSRCVGSPAAENPAEDLQPLMQAFPRSPMRPKAIDNAQTRQLIGDSRKVDRRCAECTMPMDTDVRGPYCSTCEPTPTPVTTEIALAPASGWEVVRRRVQKRGRKLIKGSCRNRKRPPRRSSASARGRRLSH